MKKFLLLILLLASSASHAAVLFADNFDDGNVADWGISATTTGSTFGVDASSLAFVSPGFSLNPFFIAPPTVGASTVRASHSFINPFIGDVTIDVQAQSMLCQGCVVSYEILLDGTLLAHTFATSFQAQHLTVAGLSAGTHTIALGIHTTNASSGRFQAMFDDLVIANAAVVPLPAPVLLLAAGLLGLARFRR